MIVAATETLLSSCSLTEWESLRLLVVRVLCGWISCSEAGGVRPNCPELDTVRARVIDLLDTDRTDWDANKPGDLQLVSGPWKCGLKTSAACHNF